MTARQTQPVAPPPSRPKRTAPAEPADALASTGTRPVPGTDLAHAQPAQPTDLASALAAPTRPVDAQQQAPAAPSSYAAFMGLHRQVDPDADLGAGPNRLPKYILAAVTLIAASTGKSRQQIVAEAITGKTPISDVILDEAFREIYGYPRPPVR